MMKRKKNNTELKWKSTTYYMILTSKLIQWISNMGQGHLYWYNLQYVFKYRFFSVSHNRTTRSEFLGIWSQLQSACLQAFR